MMDEEKAKNEQRDRLWHSQVLPKFTNAGLVEAQIHAAKNMFYAGFDAGWDSHRAMLLKEFIAENQKQKVHLA